MSSNTAKGTKLIAIWASDVCMHRFECSQCRYKPRHAADVFFRESDQTREEIYSVFLVADALYCGKQVLFGGDWGALWHNFPEALEDFVINALMLRAALSKRAWNSVVTAAKKQVDSHERVVYEQAAKLIHADAFIPETSGGPYSITRALQKAAKLVSDGAKESAQ